MAPRDRVVGWVRQCAPRHVLSFTDGFGTYKKDEMRSVIKVNSRQELALALKTTRTKVIKNVLLRALWQLSSYHQPDRNTLSTLGELGVR